MSDGELRQTMKRLMSIHDEIDEKKLDLKTVYADAKSAGFDKTALGLAIRQIRSREKNETPAAQERSAMVELYVSAFDNAPRTYVHVPARQAAQRQNPSEGEVGSAVRDGAPVSTIVDPGSQPSVRNEAEAGASPEQGSAARAGREGEDIAPAHADQFVTPAGEGEGASPSVEPSPAAERPSFARKEYVLRPHCQRPEMCSSYGSKHCGPCERAAKAAEDDDSSDVPAFVRKTRDHIAMGEQA